MMYPVYYENILVGHIIHSQTEFHFEYHDDWMQNPSAFSLSISMPIIQKKHESSIFYSWVNNLLPESELLMAASRALGVSPSDSLSLLLAMGRDTAGALSFNEKGTPRVNSWIPIQTEYDLERIINEIPKKPFFIDEEGVSISLAGAQSKIALSTHDTHSFFIPTNGSPSTHILKPDSSSLHGSVQNEAMCLTLSHLCGLQTSPLTTGIAGKRSYLLVQRYDRIKQNELYRRIHQEDFCQALGFLPSQKYESNSILKGIKGPTLVQMLKITKETMSMNETLKLLDYAVFNILCCNTDAHAKNYSILYKGKIPTISPIYDVMCADVWTNVSKNLSQKIAGKNRGDHLYDRHWIRMAEEAELNPDIVLNRVRLLSQKVLDNVEEAAQIVSQMPAGPHSTMNLIVEAITNRAKHILHQTYDMENKPASPSL